MRWTWRHREPKPREPERVGWWEIYATVKPLLLMGTREQVWAETRRRYPDVDSARIIPREDVE